MGTVEKSFGDKKHLWMDVLGEKALSHVMSASVLWRNICQMTRNVPQFMDAKDPSWKNSYKIGLNVSDESTEPEIKCWTHFKLRTHCGNIVKIRVHIEYATEAIVVPFYAKPLYPVRVRRIPRCS